MSYEPIKFPGWRYGPNGEAQIFDRQEDVPHGWEDHPNKFQNKKEVSGKKSSPKKSAKTSKKADTSSNPVQPATEPDAADPNKAPVDVTPEQTREYLMGRGMGELWKTAAELGIDKSGKKEELVERIVQAIEASKNHAD